jgi:preprotein translocase YajC subunit
MLFILAGFLLLMIVMSVMTSRKERRRRQEMMSALQKGSRVQMAGGIIGVVTELGDDEVVVKSEDGRIRFAKSAVTAILRDSREKPAAGEVEVKGGASRAGASA